MSGSADVDAFSFGNAEVIKVVVKDHPGVGADIQDWIAKGGDLARHGWKTLAITVRGGKPA